MSHLCHVFATFGRGGPQVRSAWIMRSLPDGYRHTVVSMDGQVGCAADLPEGVRVVAREPRHGDLTGFHFLRRLLRDARPDLVLSYNWGAIEAIAAARSCGIDRVVHAEEGFNPVEVDGQKRRRVWARRFLLPWTRTLVVPSRTLERVARQTWWIRNGRLRVIPNGVDLDRFRPGDGAEVRHRHGIGPRDFVVGTIGNLSGSKNVGMLLRAFSRACDGQHERLLVVGDGSQRQELERLAAELGIGDRTHFVGGVSDPDDHLRAMDVFALASRTEQMPLALLEAMATELPAVVTDVGDVAGMISPENRAFLRARDDVTGFAAALRELRADVSVRRRLGRANRRRCRKRYDQRVVLEAYAELYRTALPPERLPPRAS